MPRRLSGSQPTPPATLLHSLRPLRWPVWPRAGVFGKLVEAHVAVGATARSSVSERMAVVDACFTSQSATVADLDHRIPQIDTAVEEASRRGRTAGAMALADQQRKTRDGLVANRRVAMATLIEIKAQRAALTAEQARVEAATGPIRYLAVMIGTDPETAVRWLIFLMVLCCDPAAIALTVTVAQRLGCDSGTPILDARDLATKVVRFCTWRSGREHDCQHVT
jgi:hypothetical protein